MEMNLTRAVEVLHKFFMMGHDAFYTGVPQEKLIEWAQQIRDAGPSYKLTWQQHHFLVGRGWVDAR